MSLSHDISAVKNMPRGHIKVKKGSNMATPCQTTKSVLFNKNMSFSGPGRCVLAGWLGDFRCTQLEGWTK